MTLAQHNLPDFIAPFFWDTDFAALTWQEHRDFMMRRLLQSGDWPALCWLRDQVGEDGLRAWIEDRRGAGLSPRQLRFWELALDLPHRKVSRWIQHAQAGAWQRRLNP